ncbi:MAG TPA: hypothetical protein VMW24_28640 [Sedimentisphaerales bacterium]|nr:hypothetical protein [Sedimentisphaerales bacterium]
MMDWKNVIDKNWSRKAQLVLLTLATIVILARTADVDAEILKLALVISGIVGLVGLIAQTVLDWKHPKNNGHLVEATLMDIPAGVATPEEIVEVNRKEQA